MMMAGLDEEAERITSLDDKGKYSGNMDDLGRGIDVKTITRTLKLHRNQRGS